MTTGYEQLVSICLPEGITYLLRDWNNDRADVFCWLWDPSSHSCNHLIIPHSVLRLTPAVWWPANSFSTSKVSNMEICFESWNCTFWVWERMKVIVAMMCVLGSLQTSTCLWSVGIMYVIWAWMEHVIKAESRKYLYKQSYAPLYL